MDRNSGASFDQITVSVVYGVAPTERISTQRQKLFGHRNIKLHADAERHKHLQGHIFCADCIVLQLFDCGEPRPIQQAYVTKFLFAPALPAASAKRAFLEMFLPLFGSPRDNPASLCRAAFSPSAPKNFSFQIVLGSCAGGEIKRLSYDRNGFAKYTNCHTNHLLANVSLVFRITSDTRTRSFTSGRK